MPDLLLYLRNGRFSCHFPPGWKGACYDKELLEQPALAEISCYLAFAGLWLYLVRSGRYLSYVTPKLAPYLCFSAAVMVVWALSSLGRVFRIQYRKHIAHCFVLAIPLLLLLLPHDTVGLRDISDSAGLLNGSMVSGAQAGGGGIPGHRKPHTVQSGGY